VGSYSSILLGYRSIFEALYGVKRTEAGLFRYLSLQHVCLTAAGTFTISHGSLNSTE